MDEVDQSITVWIHDLKHGNPLAADQVCERYWTKVAAFARKRLGIFPRRVADEEDVAASVLASLCRGAQCGRYPRLTDRDDLWRLLVVLTVRKVCDYYEREGRKKRGGGKLSAGERADALEQVLSREPTGSAHRRATARNYPLGLEQKRRPVNNKGLATCTPRLHEILLRPHIVDTV